MADRSMTGEDGPGALGGAGDHAGSSGPAGPADGGGQDNAGSGGATPALDQLTMAVFEPHVGTVFTLSLIDSVDADPNSPPEPVEVTLSEATESPKSTPRWAKRTAFSLLFTGPESPVLPQGMYALDHAALGRVEPLLAVPIQNPNGPFDRSAYYQIIIN